MGKNHPSSVNERRAASRYRAPFRIPADVRNYIVSTAGVPDPRNPRRSVIYGRAA